MQKISSGASQNANWDNSLVQDIGYIKSKLRYRGNKARLVPVIFWSVFTLLIILLLSISIYLKIAADGRMEMLSVTVAISALVLFIVNIARYLQSLKFISVNTGMALAVNMDLLHKFLQSQQLLTFRHPDAPEIFQILSRNLSAGKEDREVIIFIADDNRILINSHFTNAGWGFAPAKRHHNQMASMLQHFIKEGQGSSSIIHKSF